MALEEKPTDYQWALPDAFKVAADELKCRLDFYGDAIVMYLLDKGVITTKVVSARDISLALLREVSLTSGLLPEGALFWGRGRNGIEVGLWRRPKIWRVALQVEAFKPPRRFNLPMPGLVFVCYAESAPKVFAAKKKPTRPKDLLYNAPVFNVFRNGTSCPGTHKYPKKIEDVPESFFTSFFTISGDFGTRSVKHPKNLLDLWEELDGKKSFPLDDLVKCGTMGDIMK